MNWISNPTTKEVQKAETYFDLNKPCMVRPVGESIFTEVHAIPTRQGYPLNVPCAYDVTGTCYPCGSDKYRVTRKNLFFVGLDLQDEAMKVMRMSQTGAGEWTRFLEGSGVVPTEASFRIARQKVTQFNWTWSFEVIEQKLFPLDGPDLRQMLLDWASEDHLEDRIVDFKSITPKRNRDVAPERVGYVELDDPEI